MRLNPISWIEASGWDLISSKGTKKAHILDHPARKQRNFESFEHSSKRALLQIKFLQWRRGSNVVFPRLTFNLFAPASADPASGTALALSLHLRESPERVYFDWAEWAQHGVGDIFYNIIHLLARSGKFIADAFDFIQRKRGRFSVTWPRHWVN